MAVRGSVFIRKRVAPIRILRVAKGRSPVSASHAHSLGFLSRLAWRELAQRAGQEAAVGIGGEPGEGVEQIIIIA